VSKEKIFVHPDPIMAHKIPWYLEKLHEYLIAIQDALGQRDFETIQTIGHRMKGSGVSFGFDAVSDIGRTLEASAKEENAERIREQTLKFSDYLARVEVVQSE